MPYIDEQNVSEYLASLSGKDIGSRTSCKAPEADEEYKKAHAKIERLLMTRDRSVHEIEQRLKKDGFSPRVITAVVARCVDSGLLDDARFADTLIYSRLNAGKGVAGIARDLRNKYGIDPSTIEGFPDAYLQDAPSQYDAALALLQRKPPRAKNQLQAAYAKLIRNGYDSAIAYDVAHEWYGSCIEK